MDEEPKQPLAVSALNNVATVRPLNTKIPTPGSRLPTAHRFTASKRKAPNDLVSQVPEHDDEKKVKLNLSISSDSSEASTVSTVSAVSAASTSSSRSNKALGAGKKPPTVAGRPRQPVTTARKPVSAAPSKRGPTTIVNRGSTAKPPNVRKPTTATSTVKKPAATAAAAKTEKPASAGKKRAAWDLKGRLLDMEEAMSKSLKQSGQLQQSIDVNNDRIKQLEELNQQLEGTVAHKEKLTTEASEEIRTLKHKLQVSEDELAHSTRQLTRVTSELDASQQEASGLRTTVSTMTAAQFGMKAELEATKINLEQAVEAGRLKDEEISSLKIKVSNLEESVRIFEADAREHEAIRRKMHNTIQELKGNIRVFCRVRPLLGEEAVGNDGLIEHIHFPEDEKVLELVKIPDAGINETQLGARRNADNRYEFGFDRVFNPQSKQSVVFEEISQLVQSALDGFNVCIFAYGQTGSGKTYTMEGPDHKTEEDEGMIPRSVAQIFKIAADLREHGWKYEFEVSFLEIYNESIRDLLGNGKDETKHDIKMVTGAKNEVYVSNLTLVKVTEGKEVHQLLRRASENRAVGATKCNERSSRSHSVFRMKLTGHNIHTDQKSNGLLNLIDLAGSERLKDSGSQGMRLKETQNINASLANLGNVIMALANKDSHIPYRNSKLTYLLQNSLGGNSKTLMFVNVSPKEDCFNETLNSLRFATKVNNCNIGTAQKRTTK